MTIDADNAKDAGTAETVVARCSSHCYLPDPYFADDDVTLYHGDCRDILPLLEPVDLVLTDPPYPKEFDHVWDLLADFAPPAMKDGASLFTYCGHYQVPRVIDALRRHLTYHWLCIQPNAGGINPIMHGFGVKVNFKPVLWFRKGRWQKRGIVDDDLKRSPKAWAKSQCLHKWGQPVAYTPILKLVDEGGTVLDPFAGSGTTLDAARRRRGLRLLHPDEGPCFGAARRRPSECAGTSISI